MTKRILLCDDEVHILRAAEIKFSRSGFEVRTATDGVAALEVIGEWRPDIIVTDCQMPRMNGIELSEKVRSDPGTRDIPIIMLTAKGFELSQDELLAQFGVAAVVSKPFSPRELLRMVDEVIETGACRAAALTPAF